MLLRQPQHRDFNPLPPCGGRQRPDPSLPIAMLFQSTPPMRRETNDFIAKLAMQLFQSTPPMRRETKHGRKRENVSHISIHSPHAEGDTPVVICSCMTLYFNPLPPCGGRPRFGIVRPSHCISIHSPHAEGDAGRFPSLPCRRYFNPLPPCGGRLKARCYLRILRQISIHSPHAEGDLTGNIL